MLVATIHLDMRDTVVTRIQGLEITDLQWTDCETVPPDRVVVPIKSSVNLFLLVSSYESRSSFQGRVNIFEVAIYSQSELRYRWHHQPGKNLI